ncbi:hypothetical protein BASA60_005991 [Batrachochytrium salamandrivorans]|nr:hypothetical protein BASA60_005991 [Batrachochytrium salamandrivorans]
MNPSASAFDDMFGSLSAAAPPVASVPSKDLLQLTPTESAAYARLFKMADTAGTGLILPASAVVFLSKSKLPKATLGHIWSLADTDSLGALDCPTFNRVLKYIAAVQAGHPVALASLSLATPLPILDGIHLDAPPTPTMPLSLSAPKTLSPASAIPINVTGTRIALQRTGEIAVRSTSLASDTTMAVLPEEHERFTSFFTAAGPVDGALTAQVARDLFLKSNLPMETLGKIWQLVDPTGLGKLPLNQFIVAMWLITQIRLGRLSAVPDSIPSSLWRSVAIESTSLVSHPSSPGFNADFNTPAVPQNGGGFWDTHQNVGDDADANYRSSSAKETDAISVKSYAPSGDARTPDVHRLTTSTDSISASTTAIPEAEKKRFYGFFDQLDTNKRAFLTGEEVSAFFFKSRLPPADLAQIWEYVDVSKSGKLSREGFATAMFLISKRMAGGALPSAASSLQTSSAHTPHIDKVMDQTSSRASTPAPTPTDPFEVITTNTPNSSHVAAPRVMHPSSDFPAFDRSAASPYMRGNNSSTFSIPLIPAAASHYHEAAERAAELNRRKEEVSSLTEQFKLLHPTSEELKKKHAEIDAEYKSVTDEKNKLSIQISQIRATYDAEVQIVCDSQNFLVSESQRLESSKFELAQIEEAVASIKLEKSNLAEQAEHFQREISEAKKNIQSLTEETNQWRTEVEKLRAESKQQQQFVELNQKLLLSAQVENHQLKMDLAQEREKLEHARLKSTQFQQQASVLQAINQKELNQVKSVKKEYLQEMSRSQDFISASSGVVARDISTSATSVTSLSVLPQTLSSPPTIPPLDSKPIKGEPIVAAAVQVMDDFHSLSTQPNAPATTLAHFPSSVTDLHPSASTQQRSEDGMPLKEHDRLESGFPSTMLQSKGSDSAKSSPTKSIQSMNLNTTPVFKDLTPSEFISPLLASASGSTADQFPSVLTGSTSVLATTTHSNANASHLNGAAAFPSNFDDAFGAALTDFPATVSTTSVSSAPTMNPPKPPLISSLNSSVSRKSAAIYHDIDMDAEFQRAFSTGKSINDAHDSNTIRSSISQSAHHGFTKVQQKDFVSDAFTFDGTFSNTKLPHPNTQSSKMVFDKAFSTAFLPHSDHDHQQQMNPVTNTIDAVDFSSAFDDSGLFNSIKSSGTNTTTSLPATFSSETRPFEEPSASSDINVKSASGSAPVIAASDFNVDAFGSAHFDSVFSEPHV